MQYAVIATGGKQYMASLGQSLIVESLPQAVGETVTFDQVLLVVDGDKATIGQPLVNGITVTATVVEQRLGEKLRVFKYKSKSRYSRTQGHRQHETVVIIESIGSHKAAKAEVKSEAKPATKKAAPAKKAVAEVKE